MWRDDLGSGGTDEWAGGWRLSADGTWVWDESSLLERPGAGTEAVRRASAGATRRPRGERLISERRTGDRALAALDHADPTPIFHELTVDRSRPERETRRSAARPAERTWRDRDSVSVPEPHPGSGPLPVQDARAGYGRRGLGEVPTVPPPALDGSSSAGLRHPAPEPGAAESAEDELRRRAERRRRPMSAGRDEEREGGRHTWRREEVRTGRHALRR